MTGPGAWAPPDHLAAWQRHAEEAVWLRIFLGRDHRFVQEARAEARRHRDLFLAESARRVVLPAMPWRETPQRAWRRIGGSP